MQSLYVESAAIFEELTLSGQDARLIAPWADLWRQARFLSAVDYYQIERFRRQVMIAMDEIFSQVDMFFAPTFGSFDLLMVMNFTGQPGLTFRFCFSEIDRKRVMEGKSLSVRVTPGGLRLHKKYTTTHKHTHIDQK